MGRKKPTPRLYLDHRAPGGRNCFILTDPLGFMVGRYSTFTEALWMLAHHEAYHCQLVAHAWHAPMRFWHPTVPRRYPLIVDPNGELRDPRTDPILTGLRGHVVKPHPVEYPNYGPRQHHRAPDGL